MELRLGANNLTGSIPAVLGKLTELCALDLKWNKHLTGSIPEELYDLTKLEVLNLRMTGITGTLSPKMGQWTEMDTLNLRTCTYRQEAYPLVRNTDRMTGELPKEVGRLTKMRYLDLGRQGFSGELPEQLGNCVALEDLALEECNFSGELPGSLTRLERLWQIVLTDNDLSGELPRSLGEMKYHLQSREEWLSILPDDPDMVYFDWDKDPTIDREETVKVGSETITSKNDYKTTDLGKSPLPCASKGRSMPPPGSTSGPTLMVSRC